MAREGTPDERAHDSVDRWLRAAVEDADRRGLRELRPLLESLAQAARELRAAEWNATGPAWTEGGKAGGGRAEGGEAEGDR